MRNKVYKWDTKLKKYKVVELPADWKIATYCVDMGEKVNCPHCGKEITFGEGYTSRIFQTIHGFGYAVCKECYLTREIDA